MTTSSALGAISRPTILPEEWAPGYLGRVATFNALQSEGGVYDQLFEASTDVKRRANPSWRAESLARCSGLSLDEFGRLHTLQPLFGAFKASKSAHDPKYWVSIVNVSNFGRNLQFFCPKCVDADLEFHGVSYWRRHLQIPGQLSCPAHQSPLAYTTQASGMLRSPVEALDSAKVVPAEVANAAKESTAVQRFLGLVAHFLGPWSTVTVLCLAQALRSRSEVVGSPDMSMWIRPYVRSIPSNVYPAAWLNRCFPGLTANSSYRADVAWGDSFSSALQKLDVWCYLLVMAAAFESVEDAIEALTNPAARQTAKDLRTEVLMSFGRGATIAECAHRMGVSAELAEEYIRHFVAARMGAKLSDSGLAHLAGERPAICG